VCFAITSPTSFENVKNKWLPELQHHAPGVPFILVGTKLDMREAGGGIPKQRGEQLCSELKGHRFMECSSKTQEGLKQGAFFQLDTFFNTRSLTQTMFALVFDAAIHCVLATRSAPQERKRKCLIL
jgi:GTPase SAR1 family protein